MNDLFAGNPNDVVTYTGMTQEQWDNLPGPNFTQEDYDLIATLPDLSEIPTTSVTE